MESNRYHHPNPSGHNNDMRSPLPLSSRSRAKSVPDLDKNNNNGLDVPRFVTDSRTKVTYATGQLLGRGGFAKCFLAASNRQNFALKVISRHSIKKQVQIAKIRKEIQTHFSLLHPNIVALYNTFEDAENIYMLLEYCPNRTLSDYIEASTGRFLQESQTVIFMKQLLCAVKYLHCERGLLHRDIKPGNILLSRDLNVKLADFGFCCSIRELEVRTTPQTVCGTPNYVPMEVIEKQLVNQLQAHPVLIEIGFDFSGHSVYSEYWALACTFYSMLYGRPPFHSSTLESTYTRIRLCDYTFPPERYPPVSEAAKNVIMRTLIRDRKRRLNIDEMLAHTAMNVPQHQQMSSSFSSSSSAFSPSSQTLLENESQKYVAHTANIPDSKSVRTSNRLGQNTEQPNQERVYCSYSDALTQNELARSTALAPTDSGLCSSELSGGIGKLVQQTMDKYILSLSLIMDSFNPLNLVPVHLNKEQFPSSLIVKWVDYSNKFGFAVTLRDGTRSILFNDQSSLSTTSCMRHFSYHAHKFSESCIDWDYKNGFPSSDLCSKVSILHSLREYMDRELYCTVPEPPSPADNNRQHHNFGPSPNNPSLNMLRRSRSSSGNGGAEKRQPKGSAAEQRRSLVHIIDFRKFPDALFMLLSDGTCQVNFSNTHHKLTMYNVCPMSGENPDTALQLHLLTPNYRIYSFRTAQNYTFDAMAPPLSDNGWVQLRSFRRVLQSYQHFLVSRCASLFSTYC